MAIFFQDNPAEPETCSTLLVWLAVPGRDVLVGDLVLTSAGWRLTIVTEDGGQVDRDLQMVVGYYPSRLDAALAALAWSERIALLIGYVPATD